MNVRTADAGAIGDQVGHGHLKALDGWRGVSIVLVLATHLAPLGGRGNFSLGLLGMVLFFNLSGFLITSVLLQHDATVADFLIRRFFRIVPLTFVYYLVVFQFQNESLRSWIAHFLFFANLPPPQIRLATDHMWSLCVEVQFYVGIAFLFGLLRKRACCSCHGSRSPSRCCASPTACTIRR